MNGNPMMRHVRIARPSSDNNRSASACNNSRTAAASRTRVETRSPPAKPLHSRPYRPLRPVGCCPRHQPVLLLQEAEKQLAPGDVPVSLRLRVPPAAARVRGERQPHDATVRIARPSSDNNRSASACNNSRTAAASRTRVETRSPPAKPLHSRPYRPLRPVGCCPRHQPVLLLQEAEKQLAPGDVPVSLRLRVPPAAARVRGAQTGMPQPHTISSA